MLETVFIFYVFIYIIFNIIDKGKNKIKILETKKLA